MKTLLAVLAVLAMAVPAMAEEPITRQLKIPYAMQGPSAIFNTGIVLYQWVEDAENQGTFKPVEICRQQGSEPLTEEQFNTLVSGYTDAPEWDNVKTWREVNCSVPPMLLQDFVTMMFSTASYDMQGNESGLSDPNNVTIPLAQVPESYYLPNSGN